MLAPILITLHNLTFYQDLMARMRQAIRENTFPAYKQQVLAAYGEMDIEQLPEAVS